MLNAIIILIIGMGGVFVFLLALIGVIQVLMKFGGPLPVQSSGSTTPPKGANPDQRLIAVLQAAVVAYEQDDQANGPRKDS